MAKRQAVRIEPGSSGHVFTDSHDTVYGEDAPASATPIKLKGELEFPNSVNKFMLHAGGDSGIGRDEFLFPSADELLFDQTGLGRSQTMKLMVNPEPQRVFDNDDRVRITNTLDANMLWARQICSLIITTRTLRTVRGTGWLAGPRTVVTAAHNLYFHREQGFAASIRVIPGRNGLAAPFDSFTVGGSSLVITNGWQARQEVESDYGAIRIPSSYSTSSIGFFGFKVVTDNELSNSLANISGYPVDVVPFGTQWWHGRRILDGPGASTFRYNIDTSPGDSGAPVWIKEGDARYVVGIHNYDFDTFNQATRITQNVMDSIRRWKDLDA